MNLRINRDDREHPEIQKLKEAYATGHLDRRSFLRFATLLGMAAPVAYAFVGGITPQDAIPQAQAATMPQGGTLNLNFRVRAVAAPHANSNNNLMINLHYERLTKTFGDNITRPNLLESWEASDDLRTWTLKLRPNLTYHNGRQLVSEDVIWNIRRLLEDTTGSSTIGLMKGYMLNEIDTGTVNENGKAIIRHELWDANAIEQVDDLTVRLNLKEPQLAVPEHLFHYTNQIMDPEDDGIFEVGRSNGNGPFELVDLNIGQSAVLIANKNYWATGMDLGQGTVGPFVDRVEVVDLGDDPTTFVSALASKQVMGGEAFPDQIPIIRGMSHVDLIDLTTATTLVARTNVRNEPFGDARVRKALRLAADSSAALAIGLQGLGTVGEHHHVSPIHPEYAKRPTWNRDVDEAKRLLAEAGYPDGIDLTLVVNGVEQQQVNTAQSLQESWKESGIRVNLDLKPSTLFWQGWLDHPFSLTSWGHRPLGVMVLGLAYRTGVPWNESGWSNSEFDELLTQAEGTLDLEARRAIMMRIEAIMQEEGPITQPFWMNTFYAWDKRVKGAFVLASREIFLEYYGVEE
ncbi:MAG: ABC transporter substrate-binding protein [Limnobacter sp.]|uniref:ABC transporter substrate-binding protein n=1 Tax=Pseudomonadota TaxID=1224 RepID=UPI0032EB4D9A